MDLRDKLKHYLTISNFIEKENTYSDDAVLQDAIDRELKSLKLYGKSANLPKGYLSSVTAYGKVEQRNLPSGYEELEYIESTGTQYINTGVSGNATIKITAQADIIKGSSQALLSSTSGASGGSWFGEFTTQQKWGIGTGDGLTTLAPTTKITAEIAFDGSGCSGTINNESVTRSATGTQGTWTIMATDSIAYPFNGKVWNCQIKQNGILVRNFIPAIRKSDKAVGMFDTVSGTFFGNSGTGDFLAGPGKSVPTGYTRLDYITGDGSAYIDSEITLDQDDNILVKFKANYTASTSIFGYRNSATSNNIMLFMGGSPNTIFEDFNNSDYASYRLSSTTVDGSDYIAEISKNVRKITRVSDNTVIATNTTANTDTISTGNAYVFFGGGAPTGTGKFRGSIHSVVVQGKLNLVPAKDSNNVVGMYDIINDRFLTNANETGSFTQGNEIIPTPNNPISLCCNNGIISPILPSEYRLLDYIGGTGTQYILTSIKLSNTDVVKTEFQNNSSSSVGAIYGEYVRDMATALYSNGTYYCYDASLNKVDSTIRVDTDWHKATHDFINGTLTIDDTTVTFSPYTFTTDVDTAIMGRYYNNAYGYFYNGKVRRFTVIRSGVVAYDLIPALNSSDVPGMYDIVNNVFYTNAGTGDFAYASPSYSEIDFIKTSGPKETIIDGYGTTNQFNKNHYTEITAYVNANTGVITSGTTQKCAVLPCKPNTTYKITGRTTSAWGSFTSSATGTTATTYVRDDSVLTTGPNDKYLVGLVRTTDDTYNYLDTLNVVDISSYAATCQDLMSVDTYIDEQEIIAGNVTRRIGVKVLDGTETWTKASGYTDIFFTDACADAYYGDSTSLRIAIPCTHLQGTDATNTNMVDNQIKLTAQSAQLTTPLIYIKSSVSNNDLTTWKTWLATQNTNGTPVIVIYPLKTEASSTVASQTLLRPEASIYEAGLDNLTISAANANVSTPSPETPLDIGCNNGIIDNKYEQLEYLESTGTQYIDTGIVPTDNFGFSVTIAPKNVTTDSAKFGVRDNSSTASRCWWGASSNAAYLGWNSIISQNQVTPVVIGTFYNIKVNYLNDRNYMFNGTQINITPLETLNAFSDTSTFILFGTSIAGTVTTNNSKDSKISRATFTLDGDITMDLIPVRRKADNVLGMLDLVSGNFLTNDGTGTFTAGNVIGTVAYGTQESVVVKSKNLLNKNGNFIEFNSAADYIAIPVPNGTYTCSTNLPYNVGDANGWFDNQNTSFTSQTNPVGINLPRTVTATNGYVYFAIRKTYKTDLLNGIYWVQVEESVRPTQYHNYGNIEYSNPISLFGMNDEYQVVEYLESTGTQCIDTGIKYDDNNFRVQWTAVDTSTAAQTTLFACAGASPFTGGLYGNKTDRKYYIGPQ